MPDIREQVASLLDRLPSDVSIEDIQYHLYVMEKVRNGFEAADQEGTLTQEQAEERLGKWLIE